MALKFVYKHLKKPLTTMNVIQDAVVEDTMEELKEEKVETVVEKPKKNNSKKTEDDMLTTEQISAAEMAAVQMGAVKVVKKDRGLIERTESSKVVLTEDNRQVLVD